MDILRIQQQRTGLLARGPRIRIHLLNPSGSQVVEVDGLIDTGADQTCFEYQVLRTLGYPQVGAVDLVSATGVEETPLYYITLKLPDHKPIYNVDLQVAGLKRVTPREKPFALVGRDMLDLGRFHYDGPNDVFYLDLTRSEAA